jgi:hypothetical protein
MAKSGSSTMEGTKQAGLGSSNQRNIPASLTLFPLSEKIPALLDIGKGLVFRPFSYNFIPILSRYWVKF